MQARARLDGRSVEWLSCQREGCPQRHSRLRDFVFILFPLPSGSQGEGGSDTYVRNGKCFFVRKSNLTVCDIGPEDSCARVRGSSLLPFITHYFA
jgi:hypothetical protein